MSDKLFKKVSKLVHEFGFSQVQFALNQLAEIPVNPEYEKVSGISKSGKYKEVMREGRIQLIPDDGSDMEPSKKENI